MNADATLVDNSFKKAKKSFEEAESLDPYEHAESTLHALYQALLHGARALLYACEGNAPIRRSEIIEEYGRLLDRSFPSDRRYAVLLNRAHDLEAVDNYDTQEQIAPEEVSKLLEEAYGLVDFTSQAIRQVSQS